MHKTETMEQTIDPIWMRRAFHDLCQPLTALECGLFVATMSSDGKDTQTREELVATIRLALEQCERMTGQLRLIQQRISG